MVKSTDTIYKGIISIQCFVKQRVIISIVEFQIWQG